MNARPFQLRMIILIFLSFWFLILVLLLAPVYSDQNLVNFPQKVNWLSLALFYFFVFIFTGGFSTLVLSWLKQRIHKREPSDKTFIFSLRQGFLLGLLMVILLIMQSLRVLIWWDALLAMGAVMMIELYFLAKQ